MQPVRFSVAYPNILFQIIMHECLIGMSLRHEGPLCFNFRVEIR